MTLATLHPVVITTCVQYWDFLRQTLPTTLTFASHVYIVTNLTDEVDGQITDDHRITIIRTDAFSRNGATFNKSAAIHEAQKHVHGRHPDAWILLLDADIVVSSDLCHDVHDRSTLYSVSRLDYETQDDFKAGNVTCYHTPGAGYFQLYHDKSKLYPESSQNASECDMDFVRSFVKHYITGGAVYHLGQHTVNWDGRVSEPWN